MINVQYTCPRCLFKSKHKTHFENHISRRIKPCPALANDIELTDEIIKYLLINRVYKIEKQSKNQKLITTSKSHNKTMINSHNINHHHQTINYFINTLDTAKKIQYHHEFIDNKNLQTIEDIISLIYEKEREDMLNNIGNYLYAFEDLTRMVSKISKMEDMEHFKDCVFINKKGTEETICYNERNVDLVRPIWESLKANTACKTLVGFLAQEFLKNYECYIVRKIEFINDCNDNIISNNEIKIVLNKHLDIYYRFISVFDLQAWVVECNSDSQIIFNSDDEQIQEIRRNRRSLLTIK